MPVCSEPTKIWTRHATSTSRWSCLCRSYERRMPPLSAQRSSWQIAKNIVKTRSGRAKEIRNTMDRVRRHHRQLVCRASETQSSLWGDQRQIWLFAQCSVSVVGWTICAVSSTGWMVSWWLGGQLVRRTCAIRGAAGHRHRTASYEHVPTNPGETMQSCFPNVDILLRMYLFLTATNCTGERSFSKLRRINNAQRTTIGQGRLNMLTLMSIDGRVATHDWRQLDHRRLCSRESSKAQLWRKQLYTITLIVSEKQLDWLV